MARPASGHAMPGNAVFLFSFWGKKNPTVCGALRRKLCLCSQRVTQSIFHTNGKGFESLACSFFQPSLVVSSDVHHSDSDSERCCQRGGTHQISQLWPKTEALTWNEKDWEKESHASMLLTCCHPSLPKLWQHSLCRNSIAETTDTAELTGAARTLPRYQWIPWLRKCC